MLISRPKYNRGCKKWNIVCKTDGQEVPLGYQEGFYFKNVEFSSKDKAIEYIESREGMGLKAKKI